MLGDSERAEITALIDGYGPIPSLDGISARALVARIRGDKKTIGGRVHFVLPDKIGQVHGRQRPGYGSGHRRGWRRAAGLPGRDRIRPGAPTSPPSGATGMSPEVSPSLSPRMAKGATPAGVAPGDEREASRRIREMFGRVAPRYDLLNRLLSLRVDQLWRRRLVREVRSYLERPDTRILDLCCGTGDLMLALASEKERLGRAPFSPVLGADFCRPMLAAAQSKLAARSKRAAQSKLAGPGRLLVEADALHLPLPGQSLDLITIAWGFRNLANYSGGLRECHRLLAPGGCLAILEFSQPSAPLLGPLFHFLLPRHLASRGKRHLRFAGSLFLPAEFGRPISLARRVDRPSASGRVFRSSSLTADRRHFRSSSLLSINRRTGAAWNPNARGGIEKQGIRATGDPPENTQPGGRRDPLEREEPLGGTQSRPGRRRVLVTGSSLQGSRYRVLVTGPSG